MQYNAKDPTDYVSQLAKDWRLQKVEELRSMIKSKAQSLTEGINYKMLSYGDDKGIAFHLNAQKNYVSFYVGDIHKIDPTGRLLQGLNIGKGCVRFRKTDVISETRFEEFLEKAISLWNEGIDIDC